MNLILKVDPNSPTELQDAIELLERLLVEPASDPTPDLAKIIGAVAHKQYGAGRLGYLAAVASAGNPGADIDDLMRDHFGGSHHSFGGTHSSIEKTWRARGGEAFAAKLIDDNPDGSRQIMVPEARELVLTCIGVLQRRDGLTDPKK